MRSAKNDVELRMLLRSRSVSRSHSLLDGVTGNTSEFESDILSSNLSPVSNEDVGFRLIGKASVCATEDQVSNPKVNQIIAGS